MSESDDRRQFQRISFDAPVKISQASQSALSTVIDISLKGIMIRAVGFPVDRQQPVHICIGLGEDAHIDMTARWMHRKDNAEAFRWTQVDIESMIHLRRLLELNTGDEALIMRELVKLGTLE